MADAIETDALFLSFQEAVAGQYSLQRELGRGGMGVVYLAREVRLDRPVAIKLLPPELAAVPKLRERFMREARTAARLSHPYIVPIHTVDETRGFVFYVMAYVDGETLAQRVVSRGPLPPTEATRVLREVAWAMAYAHAQGVVHRDIKPANILLERGTGRAMVTDFGIARLAQGSGETGAGEVLGTPEYMSPEQAAGDDVDARSDIYSLGIVGYYAVSGTLPFTAHDARAVLAKQVTQPAPGVNSVARGVPRILAQAIDSCLAKDPAQRMKSGEALADALAPDLERRVDVPVPIRAFLDRRRIGMALAIPAILTPSGLLAAQQVLRFNGSPTKVLLAAAIWGAIIGLPWVILATQLRPLLRLGYGPQDIATGLRVRHERQREEFLYEHGRALGLRDRVLRAMTVLSFGVSVASAGALIAGAANPAWTVGMLGGAYLGIFSSIVNYRSLRMRRGTGSFWAERWEGRMGRWLAKLASIRLGARAVAADRPTEVAIAMSAAALFLELPKEVRQTLGDVSGALKSLEEHARQMRAHIARLDASLQQVQSGPTTPVGGARERRDALVTDLRNARAAADNRLADLVTALESVRLDLLRLRAGRGNAESITQSLEAARAVGDDVDRLIAGGAETDTLLTRSDHAPSPV